MATHKAGYYLHRLNDKYCPYKKHPWLYKRIDHIAGWLYHH